MIKSSHPIQIRRMMEKMRRYRALPSTTIKCCVPVPMVTYLFGGIGFVLRKGTVIRCPILVLMIRRKCTKSIRILRTLLLMRIKEEKNENM